MQQFKFFFLFFCIFVFISAQDFDSEEPHLKEGAENVNPDMKMSDNDMNKLRTRTMSCILLTKHKMYAIQKEVGAVIDGFSTKQTEQNALYKKIFATLLDVCYAKISDIEGEKFMEEIQSKDFNLGSYEHLFSEFDINNYRGKAGEISVQLSPSQKQLYNYAEEFDKVMKEKQEKEEEEAAESQKVNPEDYEPKIAGISLKDSPEVIKFGYLIAIFAIFGGIIYWGLKSALTGTTLVGDKKRQEKKKKKEKNN